MPDTTRRSLTASSPWVYRAVTADGARPWSANLEAALVGLAAPCQALPWPKGWRAFSRISPTWPVDGAPAAVAPDGDIFANLPERLSVAGVPQDRLDVAVDRHGVIDLARHFGEPRNHRSAWLCAEIRLDQAVSAILHLGADWWFACYVDGRLVLDTRPHGNGAPVLERAHQVRITLAPGVHRLSVQVLSGGAGWTFAGAMTSPSVVPAAPFHIEARRRFRVARPSDYAGVVFRGELDSQVRLNGEALAGPVSGMLYRDVPLPASRLRRGENELTRTWSTDESLRGAAMLGLRHFQGSGVNRRIRAVGELIGVTSDAVVVSCGPFLGWADASRATLSCRTVVPVASTLTIGRKRLTSAAGLYHRFTLLGLPAGSTIRGTVRPGRGKAIPVELRTLPADGPLDVAIYGDPSPQPQVLQQVLRRMHRARPHLAVALGDLTSNGRHDRLWNSEYADLCPAFFRRTPHLWIMGNHEESCPVFADLFPHPGTHPWSLVVRNCLFIGIDGLRDWSAGSVHVRWLEARLAASAERFVVFLNHYPAWTSTGHGALGDDGRPHQRPVREAREVILPLLGRHRVSLALNGHAHCYERSLTPAGVTCITSGGAGGFLYGSGGDVGRNPYSQRFVPAHHWCRLRLDGDRAQLTAIALDGSLIDTFDLPPRPT